MKYLSKAPMFFGMAKGEKPKPESCDHKGTRKVFTNGRWHCERCGEAE